MRDSVSSSGAGRKGGDVMVFAHAGHWAVQLLYLAPLVVLVWMLVAGRLRDRRQRDSSLDPSD